MPVFQLTGELVFPHPVLATDDGLLAIGGDLSQERLLLAYANGIFPWYSEDSPILWWSPNPRMVLFPDDLKISRSLKQSLRNQKFTVRFDSNFEAVIRNCAEIPRKEQDDTWITNEMIEAYIHLHHSGFAHSVETFMNGRLVGGLYGISLGRIFYGESMFHLERDASKVALVHLVSRLREWNFLAIDAQQDTAHMRSLGARTIPVKDFLGLIEKSLKFPTIKGKWCF
ncbi:MAG: leucyl/phenylalanyl-tRNA--protein transferase [Bacteroidales bacterium]